MNGTRTRAFTLIEMLISLVVLGIVMGATIWFFHGVSGAVAGTADRMDAMQNLRYAVSTMDRELRNAGTGTVDAQPTLVYISPSVVVFNGDLVSLTPNSATAVNYNPDADPNSVSAPTTSQKFFLPTTTILYPDTTYRTTGGQLSPAETVSYWFTPDTTPNSGGTYVLLRQVNNNAPTTVAQHLLPFPGRPFFDWQETDSIGNLFAVAAGNLPMRHSVPIHASTTDTGAVAQIDLIRAVVVNAYASNGQTGSAQILREMSTTIRIPNAGLTKQRSCGDEPIFGQPVTALFTGTADVPEATVSWLPAVDETGGEKDVERYVIYRRTAATTFSGALQTLPAGQASYSYQDATVLNDSTYYYQVTALDCTPLESTPATSAAVIVPPAP
jgi:prepilin-type N-terminal cleavage/methylation domain-containing protein